MSSSESKPPTRRDLMKGAAAMAAASAARVAAQDNPPATVTDSGGSGQGVQPPSDPNTVDITVRVNGEKISSRVDSRVTLLDWLRERRGLTGTKKGCDHGACGACTVHVDGKRVLSCLTLLATIQDSDVTTIEGIGKGDTLHPVQEAFLRCDAYQCGYCTPGQILSAVSCIEEGHAAASETEAREWMSGNLCRCSAYPNILAAVRQASGQSPESDPSDDVEVIR